MCRPLMFGATLVEIVHQRPSHEDVTGRLKSKTWDSPLLQIHRVSGNKVGNRSPDALSCPT
jgi:hypothetical protein